MSVSWGDYDFQEPSLYSRGIVEGKGGVYAIMAKTKIEKGSQFYETLYFGQTDNFSERLTTSHHQYDCFKKEADKHNSEIYRELYFMVPSTEEERKEVECKLIKKYTPPCNDPDC